MLIKYWIVSSKAVVIVDRPIRTLSMHTQSPLKSQREITLIEPVASPYFLLYVFVLYVYARFDEIPSMPFQDIKETLSMHIQKPLRIKKGNNPHIIDL